MANRSISDRTPLYAVVILAVGLGIVVFGDGPPRPHLLFLMEDAQSKSKRLGRGFQDMAGVYQFLELSRVT